MGSWNFPWISDASQNRTIPTLKIFEASSSIHFGHMSFFKSRKVCQYEAASRNFEAGSSRIFFSPSIKYHGSLSGFTCHSPACFEEMIKEQ